MSFDARSKERLEALGRTLPKKLPLPEPSQASPTGGAQSSDGGGKVGEASRHSLEREQDPAELFRVLMQASPDGTVPPHLLDRLRELEGASKAPATHPVVPPSAGPAREVRTKASRRSGPASGVGKDEQDLYSAFAQLLLEDDDD